jgi:hypothetical protein
MFERVGAMPLGDIRPQAALSRAGSFTELCPRAAQAGEQQPQQPPKQRRGRKADPK